MCMAVSKKDLQCTIGKNIRDARKTCGYTKEVLAEKAEISVEHITQVERGDKMMTTSCCPAFTARPAPTIP